MSTAILPTGHDVAVTDRELDEAATLVLTAYNAGSLSDDQAANALWGWASQAAQIDQNVQAAIRRHTPQHLLNSAVTESVHSHIHDVLQRKLVDQWGQPGGFDPTNPGSFAGWVRNLSLAALQWHCSRIIEAQTRQVPVSHNTHPLDLLSQQQPAGGVTVTAVDDPLDLITAAENRLDDLHADVWADVTVLAQSEVVAEHHPLLSRQVYSASYQIPPPARPLDPSQRRRLRAALDTPEGQAVSLTVLRHKAVQGSNVSPCAYGWAPLSVDHLEHPQAPLFQDLWKPLDQMSAARLGDTQGLARWYAEAATYALPHRGKRSFNRFRSAVKSMGRGRDTRALLDQMAASWAAAEVEAFPARWRNGTEEDRQRMLAQVQCAAERFDQVMQEVLDHEAHPLGSKRQVVLMNLRRCAIDVGFVAANPLVVHLDLEGLVEQVINECPLAG